MDLDVKFFAAAAEAAKQSLCLRDRCGAVVVTAGGKVIGIGSNGPPGNNISERKCEIEFLTTGRKKPKSDCTCCIHAEWRAIDAAVRTGKNLSQTILYFTRIDLSGNIIYSGEPYCTVCSRIALDQNIGYWALWHKSGMYCYSAKEYNDLSYRFHYTDEEETS